MRLIYLIGAPGSGKSTLMAHLTAEYDREPVTTEGLPRDELLIDGELIGCELGRRRGTFSGTDALHLGIHPLACAWLASGPPERLVLAEGQRLATRAFLAAGVDGGRDVDLLWLDPPPETCAERRARRGSTQRESFVKGAATRAARLAAEAELVPGIRVHRFAATADPETVAAEVRSYLRTWGGFPNA